MQEDKKGLVRTVKIAMSPRDVCEKMSEKSLPYKCKDLVYLDVSVQRLDSLVKLADRKEVAEYVFEDK